MSEIPQNSPAPAPGQQAPKPPFDIVGVLPAEQAALLSAGGPETDEGRASQGALETLGAGALLGLRLGADSRDKFAVVTKTDDGGQQVPVGYVRVAGPNIGDMTRPGRGYAQEHGMPDPKEALQQLLDKEAAAASLREENARKQERINILRDPFNLLTSMVGQVQAGQMNPAQRDGYAHDLAAASLKDLEHSDTDKLGVRDEVLAKIAMCAGAISNADTSNAILAAVLERLALTDDAQRQAVSSVLSTVVGIKQANLVGQEGNIQGLVGNAANSLEQSGASAGTVIAVRAFGVGATLTPDYIYSAPLQTQIEERIRKPFQQPAMSRPASSGLNMS